MSATPPETNVFEHELRVAARPETVFAYFTDPARMVQWMGVEATLDPRPGGVCRIAFQRPANWAMSGRFVEVDPPRRIVLTWGWEAEILAVPPESTAVEVTFTPDQDATIVRLIHRKIPPASVNFHRAGWEHYLPRLGIVVGGGDPGRDSWLLPATAD
jgi:uncharacterized protein YndB with AHSA1/START domain